MRKFVLGWAVTGASVALGFAVAMVILFVADALLPQFRPEDDDTMREFAPAALAYAAWGAIALLGAVLAWRRVSPPR